MPRGQPFTLLCQQTARLAQPTVADLHVHTTASDGDYTPTQVVMLAVQERLSAVAITDHDTLAGVGPAADAARQFGHRIGVIVGVELSATFAGRGYHILGYFLEPAHERLQSELANVCRRRRERFREYLAHFAASGIELPPGAAEVVEQRTASLGRSHLAGLLVSAGVAPTRFDAFQRYILPAGEHIRTDHALPAERVLRLIRDASGVASLAHPPAAITESDLATFRGLGLSAIEASFPAASPARTDELRTTARRLGLVVTGGSDCHGPNVTGRAIGAKGVTRDELAALRALAP